MAIAVTDTALTENLTDFSELNSALNYLFSSFSHRHTLHKNKHDSAFRQPEIIIEIAKKLNLLPIANRTCLVTGSKGKGTVTRMIAWNLAAAGLRVGLIVTPEEVSHLDRIRIGNQTIPAQDFCRILTLLRPELEQVLQQQNEDFYFSPAGLFLLVGLMWFKEQKVEYWVIEGGRGAKYDEIGHLRAKVGVVTNILAEHLTRIGPTVEDIAKDKLSLGNGCQQLVVGTQVSSWQALLQKLPCHLQVAEIKTDRQKTLERPHWFDELDAIAGTAAHYLSDALNWQRFDTPAFFFASGGIENGKVNAGTVCCEAAIHPDCLDIVFLQRTGLAKGAALIGLSDDKAGNGIIAKLTEAGFQHFYTIALSSQIGHIQAWSDGKARKIADLDVLSNNEVELSKLINALVQQHQSLYVVGVQLFIRSMRQILNVEVANPKLL